MKNSIVIFVLGILIASCSTSAKKDYVTLSGTIENVQKQDSSLYIKGGKYLKRIHVSPDGSFSDTLKVAKDYYQLTMGRNRLPIFIGSGDNITITFDKNNMIKSMNVIGEGAQNVNYLLERSKKLEPYMKESKGYVNLSEADFKAKIAAIDSDLSSLLAEGVSLDTLLISKEKVSVGNYIKSLQAAYDKGAKTRKGAQSPKFANYVNKKGGMSSLDDFLGKYVYIDVWATWCGPCRQQFPFLQKLETEYHNKDIEFVSISTDSDRRSGGSWENAEKKWRNMVDAQNLGGVQLWAGKDNSFQTAYMISSIPRFILLDKTGKVVDADAPRPSDPRLKTIFDNLDI